MSNQRRLEGRSELLVAVEVLSGVHDRNDASMSDPPPDATGDTQPDGDGLNHPAGYTSFLLAPGVPASGAAD
ncbi:hypothetical protein RB199_11225 [Streptomyces libani]|uniref:hypothetical protein n=1 Tax=Streptomyces TaxID=1883 RepID=UPI0022581D02|nr:MULTISPECIES: hypothetical protein [Streptomyces]MCX5447941.1 hypothetical protein [Streptomyces libani]WDT58426.1 hypothetical protein NUT86_32720 [Streptomyces sp. G7(2002)]